MSLAPAHSRSSRNATAVPLGVSGRSRAPAISRQSHPAPTIARCACGGSCPRCKAESGTVGAMQVSQPGDAFEREADHVTDQVMRMAEPPSVGSAPVSIQRKGSEREGRDERKLRRRSSSLSFPSTINHQPSSSLEVPPIVHEVLRLPGRPLDLSTREFMEPRFGHDLGQVRVHADAKAARSAQRVNALAYTVGHDIVFDSGQYVPHAHAGRRLIAHELAHVIQQQRGEADYVQRTPASKVSCGNATPLHVPGPAPVDIPDPVGVITAAEDRANQMFDDVIGELDFTRQNIIAGQPASWPTISDAIAEGLRLMGLDPEDPAIWTAPSATGERSVPLLLRRLRRIRGTIGSGSFFFFCLGTGMTRLGPCVPPAGGADLCSTGAVAATCAGHFLTAFCPTFWTNSSEDQAARIIHESAHNFATFIGHTGRFTNAECFARLVQVFAGVPEALQRVDLCPNP